jgi:hypothetical protein
MDQTFFDFNEPCFQVSHGKRQGNIDGPIQ